MIFADTSFLYATLTKRDRNHEEAVSLARASVGRDTVTTIHVVGECWTLLNRRWGHHAATRFLDGIQRTSTIEMVRVSAELEGAAFEWLKAHDEREYSFVDATSFEFMKSRGITEVLAFDGDFTAAGFTELRT